MRLLDPSTWFAAAKPVPPVQPPTEVRVHEWKQAEILWRIRKADTASPADPIIAAELDRIFYDSSGNLNEADWSRINEAESLLGAVLTDVQLRSQYSILLTLAAARALPSLSTYPNRSAFGLLGLDDKRDIYGALLYELQSGFIGGRFIRRLRAEAASTLLRYGIIIAAITILVPFLWLFFTWLSLPKKALLEGGAVINETIFVLLAVACAGALGAFFSRAMKFQTDSAALTFDTVIQTYVSRMLCLRLLCGMTGAIFFYFFICGKFVGGNLFPALSSGMVTEQTIWTLHLAGPVTRGLAKVKPQDLRAASELSPTVEFAKLLVWSFLAGFSERLVTDTWASLEKKSADALQAPGAKP